MRLRRISAFLLPAIALCVPAAEAVAAGQAEPQSFATPREPPWPVLKLTGSAFPLTVDASSTARGFRAGRQYENWNAVDRAIAGEGPLIVDLPAGELGGGIVASCTDVWYRGQVDENNYPLTGVSSVFVNCPTRSDVRWTVKNVRTGPTDAELAADPRARLPTGSGGAGGQIKLRQGGRLNLINMRIRNSLDNGISADTTRDEWRQRRTGEIWVYDSDVYGHSNNGTKHNIYVHALKTFAFIRSVSRDALGGGHLLKADGEKLIVLDSALVADSGAGLTGGTPSALANITRSQDVRWARNLLVDRTSAPDGGAVIQYVPRENGAGGFSLKTPPVFDVGDDPSARGALFARLKGQGSFNATIDTPLSPASTELSVFRLGYYGTLRHLTLMPDTYTIRVECDDSSVIEFVSKPSAASAAKAVFPIPPGTATCPAVRGRYVALKKSSEAWDIPILNPRFWNRASKDDKGAPNYWWNQIRSADGTLNLAAQDKFNTFYLEDTLVVVDRRAVTTVLSHGVSAEWQQIYWGNNTSTPEIPFPPMNRPQGATSAWPDIAGASTWTSPLAGPGYPVNGRNPADYVGAAERGAITDFVWPWPVFVADLAVWKSASAGRVRQFGNVPGVPALPRRAGLTPDFRYVGPEGGLSQVAAESPLPPTGQTTLSSAHSAAAQTLNLAAPVCTVGQKIMVELPLKPGAANSMFLSTVDQVAAGGAIHTADALPRDAMRGAAVACIDKAGAKPPTWIDPDAYALK